MTRISAMLTLFFGCLTLAFVLGVEPGARGQDKKDDKKAAEKKDAKKEEK